MSKGVVGEWDIGDSYLLKTADNIAIQLIVGKK